MKSGFKYMAAAFIAVLALALPVFAGQLDDYYLAAFAQQPGSALEKAVLSPVAGTNVDAHCGTPLKHGLSRDWTQLQPATQKVLAKQLAAPTLSASYTSSRGHFTIHYDTSGTNAPNIASINQYTPGLNLTSAADWAKQVGDAFEFAYSFYQGQGYHEPPNIPYDVYLVDLTSAGEYGETQNIGTPPISFPYASSSFIQIDKDFTNDIFHPTKYTPLQSLQITSAHEFHHAIQYGYNYYFDVWYAEITSTWFEDEVWPTVNQNYTYISGWFNNSTRQLNLAQTDTGFVQAYGRWILNRYLVQTHNTSNVVRNIWEALAPIAPTNGQDIPMIPVIDSVLSSNTYNSSLSADFFGFAKRVYMRNWPTTANITAADIDLIPTYSPVASYSSYPVNSGTAPTPSVVLPHYSFAYYKFSPSAGAPASLTLTINGTSGIKATAFIKSSGGSITEYPFTTVNGTSVTIPGFGSSSEVVLLVANTSTLDGHNANFSTDGSFQAVTEPTSSIPQTSKSGGGGCFIATAAYGSYLHPQVQLLRNFRDKHLLTNAPGRAFVALYYRLSPPLADVITRHAVLRGITRLALTPIIFAVVYPLISAVSLFLFIGGAVVFRLRRKKNARSHAHSYSIHATSSRF